MHSSRIRTVRCSSHLGVEGGDVCPGGRVSTQECLHKGVSAWLVSSQRGGGVCPGGVCLGVSAWRVYAQMHTVCCSSHLVGWGVFPGVSVWRVSDQRGAGCLPHPPVNRITDACENITLPQLRCGR